INGDKFPEFVVRDDRGNIQSADGLRITVPIMRKRVTKYLSENPNKEERATTLYKAWKEEDKPADDYRHFIKHYLSPFLKEYGYTAAQVYSVIGGRKWKGVIASCTNGVNCFNAGSSFVVYLEFKSKSSQHILYLVAFAQLAID
ncbi:MAG: hypothetical protein EZS28_054336, partial [Streblomastix strix]